MQGELNIEKNGLPTCVWKEVADTAILQAGRIGRNDRRCNLPQQCRRDEILIVGARPGQMGASIGGVVDAEHNLAGEQPLDSYIPLVNVGVARRRRA